MQDLSRRRFVLGTGATITASTLAGCGSDGDNGGGGGGGGGGGNGGGDVPQEIDDYLSDANGYDGSLADHTGEDEVTVDVGGGNGLAFVPVAIRIDAGTTVTWEWTGEGGTHNVVHEDGEFESELYGEAGETFEHTFEEAGNYKYYCNPHRSSGMLGVVVVEE